MNVVIAKPGDIVECCETSIDPFVLSVPKRWQSWAEDTVKTGPAYAVYYGEELFYCSGIHIMRKGVGNAWAIFSNKCQHQGLGFRRDLVWSFRNMIEILRKTYDLKKIRTFSVKGFSQSQRLLKAIGFEKMRKETSENYFYKWGY